MTLPIFIFHIVIVVVILFSITAIVITLSNKNELMPITKMEDVEKIKILLSSKDTVENIDVIIDNIIKTAADRYMIFNVNYDPDSYLTKENSEEMALYVFGSVKMDLTDTMKSTIGLVHNIDTEEKLDDFLKLRVKMYVLALLIKTNQTINE